MESFGLVFVLPDKNNENVLVAKTNDRYNFPTYEKRINVNERIAVPQLHDTPHIYNDYFKKLTGLTVFRKYQFNTDNTIVYVFEQADGAENKPANGYNWVSYDELETQDDETKATANSVRRDYFKYNGFAQYTAWVKRICAEKNVQITGEIVQVKGQWLFRIPSDKGDLYLKISADELMFTHKLIDRGIPNLPEWIGYDLELNTFLMRDMGGDDLSSHTGMDIESLVNLFTALSRTQKDSIPYVNSADFYGYDYRIGTVINELRHFPNDAYDMLLATPYKISLSDKEKLIANTECVMKMLTSIPNHVPDTIHNCDMAAYNVRCVDGKYIFYDWALGGASHPFFAMSRLLDNIRRALPADIPAKEIIVDAYLREWSEYGSHNELRDIFITINKLLVFHVTFFLKYIRTRMIHIECAGKVEPLSAESGWLDERYKNFALYLNRFIDEDF